MLNVSTSVKACLLAQGVVLLLCGCGSHTDSAPATKSQAVDLPTGVKRLQPADVSGEATVIRQNAIPAVTPGDYVVQGETRFNGWFLSAERIIFKPDSKLIFTRRRSMPGQLSSSWPKRWSSRISNIRGQ